MQYVGFWMRVIATIIDTIIITVSVLVLSVPLGFLMMSASDPQVMVAFSFLISLVSALIPAGYDAFFVASKMMATPGKYILGMAIVRETGERLNFWAALWRHVCKFVSAIILMIGFIMVAFTERKQGLHDIMMKTVVVKRSSLQGEAA